MGVTCAGADGRTKGDWRAMNKLLGTPVTRELAREITDQCSQINRNMTELTQEALDKIDKIELAARSSESRSGSVILR